MDNELPALIKNLEEIPCSGVATGVCSELHVQSKPGNYYQPAISVEP